MEMDKKFLSIRNIRKSFGVQDVLKNVSVDIAKGELVTFIGPSGCGKTTLLRCISGFTLMDSGAVILDGKDITEQPPHKRGIGMVFQNYALFPHLSVENNIAFGLNIQKHKKEFIRKKVKELLEIVELKDMGSRMIHQISGGQQQRVALARALSLDPRLLLLDEPLSNLDANLRITMREEIKRIQKELNLTIIFVTHDQEEAMSISEKVLVLSAGEIEQIGSPNQIYDHPATEFIAGFVGHVNFIEGRIIGVDWGNATVSIETEFGRLNIRSGKCEIAAGDRVKLVIRPESIFLHRTHDSSKGNLIPGQISTCLYTGAIAKYLIRAGKYRFVVDQYDPRHCGIIDNQEEVHMEIPEDSHILKIPKP